MSHLELTRDLLMDVGGHVEMKKARAIHRQGGVRSAEYQEGVLFGETRVGGKMKKVRMEMISKTHMENHCTCMMVRRDGRVCAHIMAIGLEVIDPQQVTAEVEVLDVPVEDRWPKLSDEGKPLSLQVMLPLKVEPSWERGHLMTGFGAVLDGEEILLSALPEGPYQIGGHDEELWRVLRELFPVEAPGIVNLDQGGFGQLLEGVVGHPRVFFGKRSSASIQSKGLRRQLSLKGERIVAKAGNLGLWQLSDSEFQPVAPGLPMRFYPVLMQGLRLSAAEARYTLAELEQWFEIPDGLWETLPEEGVPDVMIVLEGSLRHLEARLEFRYEGKKASCQEGEPQLVGDVFTSLSKEKAVIDFFLAWGFEGPARGGRMALRDREEILKFHAFAEMPAQWAVEKGERFQAAATQVVAVRPDWEWQDSGHDWFSVETKYQVGGEELPSDQVQRMLRMGDRKSVV